MLSDELLPERVLAGDPSASRVLVDRIHRPLAGHARALLTTATAYLETGGSLEATARALFVHPNTVRYRLGRIAEVTGYDLAHPREAHTVAIALAMGRLSDTPPVEWRAGAPHPDTAHTIRTRLASFGGFLQNRRRMFVGFADAAGRGHPQGWTP